MKKKYFIFYLFFVFQYCIKAQVTKTPAASWIQLTNYDVTPKVNEEDIAGGSLILLYDEQIDIDKQESYFKKAIKITENVGVQSSSALNISYDPNYQTLEVNSLNIIRNGEKIDKLKTTDFNVIRRELNAENYIYDGSLSAMTNISDVRVGDVIEYSYTIKGFNPIHKGKFSTSFSLETSQPVGKMSVILHSKKPLKTKLFNSEEKLKVNKNNRGFTYSYVKNNIPAFEYEDNTPSWHISAGLLDISNYNNWKDVVDWGVTVFKDNKNLSASLKKKINQIDNDEEFEGNKIKKVIDFVQNDIRYLGLESGIGAYKPFHPNKVFAQRYGDCKDKSLLIATMLNKMGIEAYPMLVNTYLKTTINDLLPSAQVFDHCVVKVIDSEKNELYYDPTISNQGGTYKNITFPNYKYGLVLKKGNTKLDEITATQENLVEVTDNFLINKETQSALLNVTTVYYDSEADGIREYYKNNSKTSIKKEYESYYAKYYSGIKSRETPEFLDNIENNTITVIESYQIDSIWKPSQYEEKQLTADFYPYSILDMLSIPNEDERTTPYYLTYPTKRKHTTIIKMPGHWEVENSEVNIDNNNLTFNQTVNYDPYNYIITLETTFKTLKDHVSVNEFEKFNQGLKKIDNSIGYSLWMYGNGTNSSVKWASIFGPILFIILLIIYAYIAVKIYQYDPIPTVESYFEKNKQIGGWLGLIGLGLCISPLRVMVDLINNPIYMTGDWIILGGDSNSTLSMLLFFELLFNTFIIVFYPLAIILFFKKRSSFPKIYSIFLVGNLLFVFFDLLIANSVNDINVFDTENINSLLKVFISTSLIAPYLLFSERSKETFIQRLKPKKEEV